MRKRDSKAKNGNILESKKSRLWLLVSILPIFQRKKRRDITLVKSRLFIATKKVTISAIVLYQKLASILATSVIVTDNSEKIIKMSYIYHLIQF